MSRSRHARCLGSAGCQPAGLGSLPRPGNGAASELYVKKCCRQGCRQLQAGSLCSPETREARALPNRGRRFRRDLVLHYRFALPQVLDNLLY